MDASTILSRLHDLGITAVLRGDDITLQPASKLPEDLLAEIRASNPEVVEYLRERHDDVEARIRYGGYVLCYAEELQDLVVFHRDGMDISCLPTGFVPYSESELRELFGSDKPDLLPPALRLIHEAKKLGARVVSNEPDTELSE